MFYQSCKSLIKALVIRFTNNNRRNITGKFDAEYESGDLHKGRQHDAANWLGSDARFNVLQANALSDSNSCERSACLNE